MTEINKAFNGHVKGKVLNKTLRDLLADGRITETWIKTKGAPKTIYR